MKPLNNNTHCTVDVLRPNEIAEVGAILEAAIHRAKQDNFNDDLILTVIFRRISLILASEFSLKCRHQSLLNALISESARLIVDAQVDGDRSSEIMIREHVEECSRHFQAKTSSIDQIVNPLVREFLKRNNAAGRNE